MELGAGGNEERRGQKEGGVEGVDWNFVVAEEPGRGGSGVVRSEEIGWI